MGGDTKMSNFIKDPTIIFALQVLERGVKSECDLAVLTKDLNKITVKAVPI
jgi:putative transposase